MKLSNAASFLVFLIGPIVLCRASRERIGGYVATGQQFLVVDSAVDETTESILYEDPDADVITVDRVYWVCPPQHAFDSNGDGQYDNVVAHALIFRVTGLDEKIEQGASISGKWSPHGYTAAWSKSGVYEEYLFDFDDTTVHKFVDLEGSFASILGWETSLAGGTNGAAVSGVGEWFTGNATDNPRLQAMSMALGKELTGEACNERYREVWTEANKRSDSTSGAVKISFASALVGPVLSLAVVAMHMFSS